MSVDQLCHFRVVNGRSRVGEKAEITYVGVREGLVYIAPFIEERFFECSSVVRQGAFGWGELECFLKIVKSEMLCLMAPKKIISHFALKSDVVGVCRIHQEVDVSGDWSDIKSHLSKRECKRREQCVAQGFHYNVSFEDRDFFEFYHLMHLPTMKHRYGELARSVEEKEAYARLFKQGVLFRIYDATEWVAGSVSQIDKSGRILNARLIGVKNGSDTYRVNGAQNFVYHSIIEWAANNSSIDYVDFQGCEPFLTKGTFQYKKRFGTRAFIPNNNFGDWWLLMRVTELSPSVRSFLINNPLLIEGEGKSLKALYFYDANNTARLDIPFESKGIEGVVFRDLDSLHG
ncbi:hypothetical protein [Pseudomonas azotoformans]|uniref:hypothetical protein n=1 Tax=Pseudomonas azotoformans TaxID=47878 RepID=UPI00098F2E34|nr:hypothetical protein [Pseudomonas azotoformans]AQT92517.1 hypothetical protein B1R45_04340 [Pseudomonas azotoformans]UMY50280.1 hypothetical protein MLC69_04310 [Pseudomonas azotoformans]